MRRIGAAIRSVATRTVPRLAFVEFFRAMIAFCDGRRAYTRGLSLPVVCAGGSVRVDKWARW